MPDNTSATGGPLQPGTVPPAPVVLEGEALYNFLQQFVVGITGLDPTLVRPAWQPEAPNIPDAGDAWCAISILNRPADTFPFVGHISGGDYPNGADQLQRSELLNVLCSFYDLGSNGQADYLSAVFRDGLAIAQNREALIPGGMALNSVGELTPVPILFKTRWLYRVDMPWIVGRLIVRNYPVLDVASMEGTVSAEAGAEDPFVETIEVNP